MVNRDGTLWQELAEDFNRDSETSRTPANLKDKWKQMGADNFASRLKGPWSLEEALKMFRLVCTATAIDIMRSSRSVKFCEGKSSKKFELVDGEVRVYNSDQTQIQEIIPFLIKENRAKKALKSIDLVISWKAVSNSLKTRSVDDIRNFW